MQRHLEPNLPAMGLCKLVNKSSLVCLPLGSPQNTFLATSLLSVAQRTAIPRDVKLPLQEAYLSTFMLKGTILPTKQLDQLSIIVAI